MAIRSALKKAIKCIHHSCVMISTDNTTVVSDINKQGGTHIPQPMCRGMGAPPLVHGRRCYQSSTYPRQIQCFGRSSIENGQTSENRMGIGSINRELHIPNAQLPQCGSVCDTL